MWGIHPYVHRRNVSMVSTAVARSVLPLVNHERLLWANDYPHGDATWPNSQKLLAEQAAGLAPAVKERILRANVQEVYRLN